MNEREPWPKPDAQPSFDLDDARAKGRKRPAGDGYRATVLVQASTGEVAFFLDDILAVLERAARYRRLLARGMEHPVTLKGLINGHVLSNQPIRLLPNGWCKVGYVLDPFAGPEALMVWWHPDTDRIRIERPHGRPA